MRPVVVIIAHPDDEAFGPAGTIAKLSQERDVYLICATKGEEGQNASRKKLPLSQIRQQELLESAKVLGVKQVFFLGFKDGTLSNNMYHKVADAIRNIVVTLDPEIVITNELHGISGHLDHIAVAFITSFVCKKLPPISQIWYYCITREQTKNIPDYFVYFPHGYTKSQITKTVDIQSVWEKKVEAILKHQSQIEDVKRIIKTFNSLPKVDHFIVVEQKNL